MYKCTECGMEYEIKPDYCDCGNDEFVITVEEKKEEPVVKKEPVKIEKETVKESELYRPKLELPKTDPVSLVIFLICIILSFIVAFLPVKTNEDADNIKATETVTTNNILSIDKFWNNTAPVSVKPEPAPEPVVVKVVTPVKQTAKPVSKPVQTQKKTQTVAQNKTQTASQTQNKPASNFQTAATKYFAHS